MDHVLRDEDRERDNRQAANRAQLLRDAYITDPRRDGDPEPDRPDRQQRREEELRQQLRAAQHGGGDVRVGEQLDAQDRDSEDDVGDHERGYQHGQSLADQELLAAHRRRQDRLERALLPLRYDRRRGERGGPERWDP